jgi:hypothetical protein
MELSEDDEDTAPGYDKATVADLEAKLYIKFFEDNTGVLSGSVHKTRVLTIAKFELAGRLFGEFPSLLRQLNKEHPRDCFRVCPRNLDFVSRWKQRWLPRGCQASTRRSSAHEEQIWLDKGTEKS